ncbi:MAG: O-antigen ligase family protein [Candidatus Levybacteria bacterium]|nr:O-antigen ligase family protein [Candidatus Levybacteria bacterium]
MTKTLLTLCQKTIEFSFYATFFLVPLVFTSNTSELFEFNKLWLTFSLTIIIAFAWFSKMILRKQFFIQKTPLDIPIFLFFLFQLISTLLSWDMHVSLWGYYSRFNGGLLSIASYIFLYYAFVSNYFELKPDEKDSNQRNKFIKPILLLTSAAIVGALGVLINRNSPKDTTDIANLKLFGLTVTVITMFILSALSTRGAFIKRVLSINIISAAFIALWGLPSHFGYDPTCLLFRGTLDVSCWTDAFQPKIRIFSTLGQPDWLAAYLAILLPVTLGFGILATKKYLENKKINDLILTITYYCVSGLFYVDLLYTKARSGFVGIAFGLLFFFILLYMLRKRIGIQQYFNKQFGAIVAIILLLTFLIGSPINQLSFFSLDSLSMQLSAKKEAPKTSEKNSPSDQLQAGELGGTDSSKIRLIVWEGALNAWRDNPLFGTGVETFAFAYYRYRPAAHNLTSEWDYLYNKAHNEYLNFLATTGIFGLGTYLAFILMTLYLGIRTFRQSEKYTPESIVSVVGLLAGFITILVTNFFGFSVVIVNIYLFLLPAWILILTNQIQALKPISILFWKKSSQHVSPQPLSPSLSFFQSGGILLITLFFGYQLVTLITFWFADTDYYWGSNYYKVGQYEEAYTKLTDAVAKRGDEPVFKDELTNEYAALALLAANQKNASVAAQFAGSGIALSNQLVTEYPNNITFWKSRVRLFYSLGQLNPQYLQEARTAIIKAHELAPTDAKISYNLGVLYGQTGDVKKGIEILKDTIALKPDYRDAYFALGLFHRELAIGKTGVVTNPKEQEQAVFYMRYILTNLSANDNQVKQTLKSWGES